MMKSYFLRRFSTQMQPAKITRRKWKTVVGLEVHAQIASNSKLFSGSGTSFGTPLNSAVAFFDASIPGTLPVLNRRCVEAGVRTALALGCRVNEVSMFDRKHYFYADLPAGYQITQQRAALANDGKITFPVNVPGKRLYHRTVRLLQLQLEQDSGKSLHDVVMKRSLVDLNRAGIPLMELVFAPDLENGEEASSLVKELILTLRRLQTCSCRMEEGALRVDANISINLEGDPLGVRTEVKNIGSVRSIAQAITYEIKRQLNTVAQGGIVMNETRSWDAERRQTVAMRDKEVLQDYRFMPEPNLLSLRLAMTQDTVDSNAELVSVPALTRELPELPEQTRQRLMETYKLAQETAIILVNEASLFEHFVNMMDDSTGLSPKMVANFLINDLLTYCYKANINIDDCKLNSTHLKDILRYLHDEQINLHAARQLIVLLSAAPTSSVAELIAAHNLAQISDAATIETLCKQAIANQSNAVKQYRSGKVKALFAVVGEVAKLSHQKANMQAVVKCLELMLKAKRVDE